MLEKEYKELLKKFVKKDSELRNCSKPTVTIVITKKELSALISVLALAGLEDDLNKAGFTTKLS